MKEMKLSEKKTKLNCLKNSMNIKIRKNVIIIQPYTKKEEKQAEKLRSIFEDIDYKTDRCWSNEQRKLKWPLGIRIYLNK